MPCQGKKTSGEQCQGKALENGFCRHHQDQDTGTPTNVTPITEAPSAKKAAGKKSSSPVAAAVVSTPGKNVTPTGPSRAAVASPPTGTPALLPISEGVFPSLQRFQAALKVGMKKISNEVPGAGEYSTAWAQLEDYSQIAADMESELRSLFV